LCRGGLGTGRWMAAAVVADIRLQQQLNP
jgi:hypothetical protein